MACAPFMLGIRHSRGTFLTYILIAYVLELSNISAIIQACNAHGIYCVPLYDTLGR